VKALIRIRGQLYPFAADEFTETASGWVRAEGRWRWPSRRVECRTVEFGYSPRKRMSWPPSQVESIEDLS
jgi:hypothetical protein